jgi:hypothetical protein
VLWIRPVNEGSCTIAVFAHKMSSVPSEKPQSLATDRIFCAKPSMRQMNYLSRLRGEVMAVGKDDLPSGSDSSPPG